MGCLVKVLSQLKVAELFFRVEWEAKMPARTAVLRGCTNRREKRNQSFILRVLQWLYEHVISLRGYSYGQAKKKGFEEQGELGNCLRS